MAHNARPGRDKIVPRRTWNKCFDLFMMKGWELLPDFPMRFRHPETARIVYRDMPLDEFKSIIRNEPPPCPTPLDESGA